MEDRTNATGVEDSAGVMLKETLLGSGLAESVSNLTLIVGKEKTVVPQKF